MKIFCMVGMHDIGFDRLLSELDAIAERNPDWEILIQKGYSALPIKYARAYDFKPGLMEDISWADIVVSHGSVCILDALKAGRRLIVVPRLARYGEAINDHQLEWAGHFTRRFHFPILVDVAGLESTLNSELAVGQATAKDFQPTGLYLELRKYLETI